MSFIEELQNAFFQLKNMLNEDQNADMLDMAYAEFTLKCYAGYADRLYSTLLRKGAPLSIAMNEIGVDMPRDQLLVLLNAFYLSLHSNTRPFN